MPRHGDGSRSINDDVRLCEPRIYLGLQLCGRIEDVGMGRKDTLAREGGELAGKRDRFRRPGVACKKPVPGKIVWKQDILIDDTP